MGSESSAIAAGLGRSKAWNARDTLQPFLLLLLATLCAEMRNEGNRGEKRDEKEGNLLIFVGEPLREAHKRQGRLCRRGRQCASSDRRPLQHTRASERDRYSQRERKREGEGVGQEQRRHS